MGTITFNSFELFTERNSRNLVNQTALHNTVLSLLFQTVLVLTQFSIYIFYSSTSLPLISLSFHSFIIPLISILSHLFLHYFTDYSRVPILSLWTKPHYVVSMVFPPRAHSWTDTRWLYTLTAWRFDFRLVYSSIFNKLGSSTNLDLPYFFVLRCTLITTVLRI